MDVLKALGLKAQEKNPQKPENPVRDRAISENEPNNPHESGRCCGSCGGGRH
ncbi:MAG: hypothetical protein KA099_07310 [Alphaproteobacteria bacterium]|nr:hypothetical protein [Alphaproteobacteria bacterium]MBP7758323.1 hypothetical protein [Alphaproteobacteria bacterium]MBP7761534.1 hypothetical protein [Alphaproteobacteria bacterium]MBP7905119.1 hypothetical protein [Alphaproteobacteria bacterium]